MTNSKFNATTDSSVFLYGKGIFTTLAISDRILLLWDKHWTRLQDNAAKMGLDLSAYDERSVLQKVNEVIERDGLRNGRARITFFDESRSPIWSANTERKTGLSIITGTFRPISNRLKLTVSPYLVNSTSPLAGVKSCNYLENILALDEAKTRGFNEAIRVNERGEVTSGCMSNVFWLKDGQLFTPSLSTGCLAGTTREFIIENAVCNQVEATLDEIRNAEAIFLTSAGLGIAQVAEFDGQTLKPLEVPILKLWPTL